MPARPEAAASSGRLLGDARSFLRGRRGVCGGGARGARRRCVHLALLGGRMLHKRPGFGMGRRGMNHCIVGSLLETEEAIAVAGCWCCAVNARRAREGARCRVRPRSRSDRLGRWHVERRRAVVPGLQIPKGVQRESENR
eukprot:6417547-Prymnesium_polylepis.1